MSSFIVFLRVVAWLPHDYTISAVRQRLRLGKDFKNSDEQTWGQTLLHTLNTKEHLQL